MINLPQLQRVCPMTQSRQLEAALPYLTESFSTAGADTLLRQAMYIAQAAHECMAFTRYEENLNYTTPESIVRVFPREVPTLIAAAAYVRNPQKLANRVYADRYGNGDEESGDGWRYRGRGAGGVTFFENYKAAGVFLTLDLVGNPDLAAQLENAFKVWAWFWRVKGLNAFADRGDVDGATKKINPGLAGLTLRKAYYDRCRSALGLYPKPPAA